MENIEDLVRSSSARSKERVIGSQLQEVFQKQNVSTTGGSVLLATGGRPLQATLGHVNNRPVPKFSSEVLNRLQSKIGVSDSKMNVVGNFLRVSCGRDSVVNLQQNMIDRNKLLEDQFEVKIIKQHIYEKDPEEDKENIKAAVF